jgi:hypothetical protein
MNMASSYDKKMFDFFTSSENFESAFEIHQKFPEILDALRRDFWESVSAELNLKCSNSDWVSYGKDEDGYLGLFLPTWKDNIGNGYKFWIGFGSTGDRLFYGIEFELKRRRGLDKKKLDVLTKNGFFSNLEIEDEWWFKQTDYNFRELYTLRRTLPTNRSDFITELVETLWEFAEKAKPNLAEIEKMVLK